MLYNVISRVEKISERGDSSICSIFEREFHRLLLLLLRLLLISEKHLLHNLIIGEIICCDLISLLSFKKILNKNFLLRQVILLLNRLLSSCLLIIHLRILLLLLWRLLVKCSGFWVGIVVIDCSICCCWFISFLALEFRFIRIVNWRFYFVPSFHIYLCDLTLGFFW